MFLFSCLGAQCEVDLRNYVTAQAEPSKHIFNSLAKSINNSKLIGIGEDTHGSSEFTEIVEHLVDYLSGNYNSIGVFVEMPEGEAQLLNELIHSERDDYNYIINDVNTSWRYKTKEFKALIDKMTILNSSGNEVSFYGTEVQIVKESKFIINRYLNTQDSDIQLSGFEYHIWQDIPTNAIVNDLIDVNRVEKELANRKVELIKFSSEAKYNNIIEHLNSLKNFISINLQSYDDVKHDLRDIYMAQNILSKMSSTTHEKYIYWAHNSHVGKDQQNGPADVAGRELYKKLKDNYFVLKTDFGNGDFMAYRSDSNEKGWVMEVSSYGKIDKSTISYCIEKVLKPNENVGIVNVLDAVQNDTEISLFFNSPQLEMSGAGSQARPNSTTLVNIFPSFDAIIYFRKSTPINFLSQGK